MKIKTSDLLESIEAVLPGTSNKGIIDGADGIIFADSVLLTYNDRLSVSVNLDTGINCGVIAEDLYKIVKGIKNESDSVVLEIKEDVLNLTSQGTEAGLSTFSDENILNFIKNLDTDSIEFASLPENFIEGLNLCQFSTAKNIDDDLNLFCIKVSGKEMFSSDRYRITMFTLNKEIKGETLLPRSSVPSIINFNPDGYYFKNGWAYFINESDAVLSCRVVDSDKFADIKGVLKQHKKGKKIQFPEDFKEILPEIVSISDEILDVSKHVEISIKDGLLTCHLKKVKGWLKKKYEIKDKEIEIEFPVSAAFLSEILKVTNEMYVGNQSIIIKTGNMKHLITLPNKE